MVKFGLSNPRSCCRRTVSERETSGGKSRTEHLLSVVPFNCDPLKQVAGVPMVPEDTFTLEASLDRRPQEISFGGLSRLLMQDPIACRKPGLLQHLLHRPRQLGQASWCSKDLTYSFMPQFLFGNFSL